MGVGTVCGDKIVTTAAVRDQNLIVILRYQTHCIHNRFMLGLQPEVVNHIA